MPFSKAVDSRILLTRLRETLAEAAEGQERLNRIVRLIADGLVAEVCSVYLRRDDDVLELCATEGLKAESVHLTRLRLGQGLVGRIAESATPLSTRDAPRTPGFRFMPETGEEIYASFLGVPIQRLGEVLGVLVVQNVSADDRTDMTFTVPIDDLPRATKALEAARERGDVAFTSLFVNEDVAKVSIVGIGMRSHAGVAHQMFQALAAENINIKVITTSEIKVSVLVDRKYLELAVQALHDAFELEKAS